MIIRRRVAREKLIDVPHFWRPVVRRQMGWEIYYRWEWSGLFDRRLKTVWSKQYKDFTI